MTTKTTAPTLTVAPEPKTRRGFPGLRCPHCGQEDVIALDLEDCNLSCRNEDCGEPIDPADVRAVIAAWQRVLTWLETAPPLAD